MFCWFCKKLIQGESFGMPIRLCPALVMKDYWSEITERRYVIIEGVSKHDEFLIKKDPQLSLYRKRFWKTEGYFCDVKCCLAYIRDDPSRKKNELILKHMLADLDII
jgi:hypothetical protein